MCILYCWLFTSQIWPVLVQGQLAIFWLRRPHWFQRSPVLPSMLPESVQDFANGNDLSMMCASPSFLVKILLLKSNQKYDFWCYQTVVPSTPVGSWIHCQFAPWHGWHGNLRRNMNQFTCWFRLQEQLGATSPLEASRCGTWCERLDLEADMFVPQKSSHAKLSKAPTWTAMPSVGVLRSLACKFGDIEPSAIVMLLSGLLYFTVCSCVFLFI